MAAAYAEHFEGTEAVARYQRKLSNRIDRIRHRLEADLLARHAFGDLFDCTIGVGRFIGLLPRVRRYSGFDISDEFVEFVRHRFVGTEAAQGDLTKGIPEPDDHFDTALCLRSLSAIGHLDTILAEMVRIVRPGGYVIVDYGVRPAQINHLKLRLTADAEDFDGVVARLNADVVASVRCDALLVQIKRRGRVFRFFDTGLGAYVPDGLLLFLERMAVPLLGERKIVVLRKRGAAA